MLAWKRHEPRRKHPQTVSLVVVLPDERRVHDHLRVQKGTRSESPGKVSEVRIGPLDHWGHRQGRAGRRNGLKAGHVSGRSPRHWSVERCGPDGQGMRGTMSANQTHLPNLPRFFCSHALWRRAANSSFVPSHFPRLRWHPHRGALSASPAVSRLPRPKHIKEHRSHRRQAAHSLSLSSLSLPQVLCSLG